MSATGDNYKTAQETVLKRYATELGSRGQSQKYKITDIARITATPNDQLTSFDIRTFHEYMDEIEEEMTRIEIAKPIVEVSAVKKEPEKLAVADKKPAEPTEPSLPESPHGIDLDWN
jgi:predicted AAA+ superfamily ATPase